MTTLPLVLDDDLDAALETVSAVQGRAKADIATEVLRKYVQAERLRQTPQDAHLVALYKELAEEDVQLAEQGMAEYQHLLDEADHA